MRCSDIVFKNGCYWIRPQTQVYTQPHTLFLSLRLGFVPFVLRVVVIHRLSFSFFRKMTFGKVNELGQFIREAEPEPDVKKSKGMTHSLLSHLSAFARLIILSVLAFALQYFLLLLAVKYLKSVEYKFHLVAAFTLTTAQSLLKYLRTFFFPSKETLSTRIIGLCIYWEKKYIYTVEIDPFSLLSSVLQNMPSMFKFYASETHNIPIHTQ